MPDIHSTAVVSPNAVADGVVIGPLSVVDDEVTIGPGTTVGPHVHLTGRTTIGTNCRIHHGGSVGGSPQTDPATDDPGRVAIGDDVTIREGVTINSSSESDGVTTVGSGTMMMALCHVGHDAKVGENVTLANGATLGGHVVVGESVGISAMVPVHQWCRIGAHAYIGGGFRVVKDVPPFILAAGEPLRSVGLNLVGLRRCGFDEARIKALKKLYRLFFRSDLNTSQALDALSDWPDSPDNRQFAEFVKNATRGIIK